MILKLINHKALTKVKQMPFKRHNLINSTIEITYNQTLIMILLN